MDRQDRRARHRFPLHVVAALAVFVLLAVAVATLSVQTYRGTQDILREDVATFSRLIQSELTVKIRNILDPAQAELELLVHSDLPQATDLSQRLAEVPLVLATLGTGVIDAAYFGYSDGSFILFRPLGAAARREHFAAPAGAVLLVQSIGPDETGTFVGEYRYFDAKARLLRTDPAPNYVFDPRRRPWYLAAARTEGAIVTEPYIFFTSRAAGTTIARRAAGGVAGVDVTLASLAAALAELRITPSTELAIVAPDGRVIGYRDPARMLAPAPNGGSRLPKIGAIGVPPLAHAATALDRSGAIMPAEIGGRGWQLIRSDIPLEGQTYRLLLAVPNDELFADARGIVLRQWLAAALILAVAATAGWYVARRLARPIRQLALETDAIGAFDFSRDIKVPSILSEVDSLSRALGTMKATIRKFVRVGTAMSAERHLPALLNRVLVEALDIANGKGGVIYLLDSEGRQLNPQAVRRGDGEPADLPERMSPLSLGNPRLPIEMLELLKDPGSGLRAWKLEASALALFGCPASDADGPGAARPVFAMPLLNRSRAAIGVLLIVDPGRGGAVTAHLEELLLAIGGGAGIAIENQQLLQAQKDLMNALIKLIAGAIDAKSPYTGGHCQRVPALTHMLAAAACAETEGPFADFQLSEEEWEAVDIAAWLHDCGKVTTPEFVVDKATKLEGIHDRLHEIRMRFEVLKRDAEIAYWQGRALGGSEDRLRAERDAARRILDEEFAFVAACNEGGEFMDPERIERLKKIGARRWRRTLDDRIGLSYEERARKSRTPPQPLPVEEPLLADREDHLTYRTSEEAIGAGNPWGIRVEAPRYRFNRGEIYNLSIGRGTLTAEERHIINDHMTQTIMMLQSLPLPQHLRNVPEIAGGHHEKMDGTGYPKRLTRGEMSPAARMMAIADVFEALTAGDRPYKKAKTLSEAIRIMAFMKRDNHLDPDLLDLFIRANVWKDYAERFLAAEQIDTPDVEFVLAMRPVAPPDRSTPAPVARRARSAKTA